MMRCLLRGLGLIGLLVSCSPRIPELEEIDRLRPQLRQLLSTQGPQSTPLLETALKLARTSEAFARKYPNYTEAPDALIEAAEIYGTYFGDARKAVELLAIVDQRYRSKHPSAPKALFYEAFLYENMLYDTTAARERYEAFLRYYPDHELAPQAQASLKHLGKTPEQILQDIQRNRLPY